MKFVDFFNGELVGKYTSPMDPMGYDMTWIHQKLVYSKMLFIVMTLLMDISLLEICWNTNLNLPGSHEPARIGKPRILGLQVQYAIVTCLVPACIIEKHVHLGESCGLFSHQKKKKLHLYNLEKNNTQDQISLLDAFLEVSVWKIRIFGSQRR